MSQSLRHRAAAKPVHSDGEPCTHRKGEPCPGRQYRAVCKRPGCSFDEQQTIKAALEYVRDTSSCPLIASPASQPSA
ncbi:MULTISPECIES: hypothetical protein [unclassified Streptomyces]|uniref:Uncharacterized protein n=1 Tax=Streptomyces sp. F12 TaxID=1436084 RepID=V9Z9P1_9ACTN|nr:hypothetical protein [Streptomyces sp. F12]AHE40146.1 hypothetical protein pFRL6_59 [Streptomyces sp. F12]